MIERVIENWLTSTNERGYEIPFCQCLISEGYTILELSFHGQIEQGKDIIALDKEGVPCAYQLKSGLIDKRVWNNIKAEIDDLIEIPIKYPKLNNEVNHRCILVTNRRITAKVKADITDRNFNFKRKGVPELEIIQGHELLKKFLNIHGTFLPTNVPDLRTFLELFMFDGRELLNKKLFASFLESILFTKGESDLQLGRKIASSILLTQYVLEPFESQSNHVSIVEGWTILSSYFLQLLKGIKLMKNITLSP